MCVLYKSGVLCLSCMLSSISISIKNIFAPGMFITVTTLNNWPGLLELLFAVTDFLCVLSGKKLWSLVTFACSALKTLLFLN